MRRLGLCLIPALLLGACSRNGGENSTAANSQAQPTVSSSSVSDAIKPAAAVPAALAAVSRSFPGHINAPSDLDMVMIYFDHVGTLPPIARWVDNDYDVKYADEFKKDALQKDKAASLQSQFEHDQGVGFVQLVSSAGLGEYSKEYGEFHISALSPGRGYTFEHDGVHVSLTLTNAADFYRLPMDQDHAQKLAEKYGGRSVRVELGIQIDSARPEGDGGTLEGHISKLRVLAADGTEITGHS